MELAEVLVSPDVAESTQTVLLRRLADEPLPTGRFGLSITARSSTRECSEPFDLEIVR